MKESKVWLLFNLKRFQVAFKLGRKQLAGFSSRVQSYDSRLFRILIGQIRLHMYFYSLKYFEISSPWLSNGQIKWVSKIDRSHFLQTSYQWRRFTGWNSTYLYERSKLHIAYYSMAQMAELHHTNGVAGNCQQSIWNQLWTSISSWYAFVPVLVTILNAKRRHRIGIHHRTLGLTYKSNRISDQTANTIFN